MTKNKVKSKASIAIEQVQRDCFCLQSRMTARAVTRQYNLMLAPVGLEITEYSLLGALALNETSSITELANCLAFERTTLVRNLKRMEERGLIEPANEKGRAVRYVPTQLGLNLLRRAFPLWQAAQASITQNLHISRTSVMESLVALRRTLSAGDDPA